MSLRRLLWLPALILAAGLGWTGGLVWFAETLPRLPDDAAAHTDAIVVLTGGPMRLRAGLDMLQAGRAGKLFVSGVSRGVDVADLLRAAERGSADLTCCIALGYAADNTAGNAAETAAWMRGEGFRSLRLVTASYHMPRSLLEFRRALPGAVILAHPVIPDSFRQRDWWRWPGTASLLIQEYNKYLLALLRPWLPGLLPEPGAEPGSNATARAGGHRT